MGEWVILKGCPQQTTFGEALGVKGRNPIESVCYKRKVTTAEKKDWNGEEKHRKKGTQGGGGT